MKTYFKILLLFVSFLWGCGSELHIDDNDSSETVEKGHGDFLNDYSYTVYPKDHENFDSAQFTLWMPEEVTAPRALLILLPVHNGSSQALYNDVDWREFAISENLAVITCTFFTDRTKGVYVVADEGSGRALIEAIDKIADHNELTELKKLKYVMRGYEVGGSFCVSFSEKYPNKVASVATIRGTSSGGEITSNLKIPVLMVIGENDFRLGAVKDAVLSKRSQHGLWALAIEPNKDTHGSLAPSDQLIRSYFTEVLPLRINNEYELIEINENTGWLGDHNTLQIKDFNSFTGEYSEASWLIDESFANKWRIFLKE